MKNQKLNTEGVMKKKVIFVAILAIVAVAGYFVYDYYNAPLAPNPEGVEMSLILIDNSSDEDVVKTILYRTTAGNLMQALTEMQQEEKIGSFSESDGFINSIDILENKSAQGYWVFLYTSLQDEKYISVDEFSPPLVYKEKEYFSCSKGASEMPIVDGVEYIITYVYYG